MGAYGVSGRLFVGDAITAIDGSGGTEIAGVEGDRYALDSGMFSYVDRDGIHHTVKALPNGPGVLSMPLKSVDTTEFLTAFGLITADGILSGPDLGPAPYTRTRRFNMLLLPLDPSKDVVFFQAAQLHPETQARIEWHYDAPRLPGETMILASSDGDADKAPWRRGAAAAVAAYYGLTVPGGD